MCRDSETSHSLHDSHVKFNAVYNISFSRLTLLFGLAVCFKMDCCRQLSRVRLFRFIILIENKARFVEPVIYLSSIFPLFIWFFFSFYRSILVCRQFVYVGVAHKQIQCYSDRVAWPFFCSCQFIWAKSHEKIYQIQNNSNNNKNWCRIKYLLSMIVLCVLVMLTSFGVQKLEFKRIVISNQLNHDFVN